MTPNRSRFPTQEIVIFLCRYVISGRLAPYLRVEQDLEYDNIITIGTGNRHGEWDVLARHDDVPLADESSCHAGYIEF